MAGQQWVFEMFALLRDAMADGRTEVFCVGVAVALLRAAKADGRTEVCVWV
jgi:hypothetical protein